MNSNKPIWWTRAKSVRVTKSGTLTVEDARAVMPRSGKKVLNSKARQVVKKSLRKKRRQLDYNLVKGFEP